MGFCVFLFQLLSKFKFVGLFGLVLCFLKGGTGLIYVSMVLKMNPIQSHLRSLTLNVYSL